MDHRNRPSQTMNNNCYPIMNLYNGYLPEQRMRGLRDAYQHLQIPLPSTNLYEAMIDRVGYGQGTPSTPRPNSTNPALQAPRNQWQTANLVPAQTPAQQQDLQHPQYSQNSQTPHMQSFQTNQSLGAPNARQLDENGQMLFDTLTNTAQHFTPQLQMITAQQYRAQQIRRAQQTQLAQQMAAAAGYPQIQSPHSSQQYPAHLDLGIPQNYSATYPNEVFRSPQLNQTQQPTKRPAPYNGAVPSPKRARVSSQASPTSAISSPRMFAHGHPGQTPENLLSQQQYLQAYQQQRRNQQEIDQQFQRKPQQKQQHQQGTPPTPHRSPSIQSNHSVQQANTSPTSASSQGYPVHSDLRQPAGSPSQWPQTPQPPPPGMIQPFAQSGQTLQTARRSVVDSIQTAMPNLEQSRRKMLKSGFIKTPDQLKKLQANKQKPSSMVSETKKVRQLSQQASVVASPALPTSSATQYLPQHQHQCSDSIAQPIAQRRNFPVHTDATARAVQQANQPVTYGAIDPVQQAGTQPQRSITVVNNMPSPSPHILRQNLVKQNANLLQQRPTTNPQPVQKQTQFSKTSVQPVLPANAHPTRNAPLPTLPAPADENMPPDQLERVVHSPGAPSPKEKEWATYVVDRAGTRYPKSQPPPQGSYYASKVSGFGSEARDYSDPRDFYAPMPPDRNNVWHALGPTRDSYFKITGIKLERGDLHCLELGYNAARDEIKRHANNWVLNKFGPDPQPETKSGSDRKPRIEMRLVADAELPGYSRVEVEIAGVKVTESNRIEVARRAQEGKKYFEDGKMVFDAEKSLFKLERWYGLLEDYHYAPNWPGKRLRNRAGVIMQNPDVFACNGCRESGRLCYGHKEHVDRKCEPCQEFGLECSKEENYVQREPGKLERVRGTPEGRKVALADELRTKYQTVQRNKNVAAAVVSTKAGTLATSTAPTANIPRLPGRPAGTMQPPQRRGKFGQRKDWMRLI